MRGLSFCLPLASVVDKQPKNFTVVIPTDYDLDSVLFVEFIQDFWMGVFWTNQVQTA
jgi:hypothetical protein